jgi:adenylate cyclase
MDTEKSNSLLLFLLLSFGAILFAIMTERLQSIPALLLFLAVMTGMGVADLKLLFENQINWNTGLFYVEYLVIFMMTFGFKYWLEEKNKKFIRSAFSKYVAPAVVDSILKDPTKLTVGGEKRELTILFSDIRGFTSFSEKMDAKELAGFLNDYLGEMTDIVFDTDGTLDKYIGDAVMAFWGAPVNQTEHASNALKAAVAMQKKLSELRPIYREKYGVDVHIGIGVNSGTVNVGNMGSERIFEYTVIGDHVNLASRLEGLTKPYHAGILTTRFTIDLISQSADTVPAHRTLDFVKVKGKKLAVELIEIFEHERNPAGTSKFEEARTLYSQQKWDESMSAFREAIELFKQHDSVDSDGPSLMYIERCEEFKRTPPGPDWDGSWEMHSK